VNRATQLNGHERHSLRLSTWQPVLALIFWVMIGGRRGKPIPATATANNAIRSVTPAWERSVSHKVESGNLTLLFLFDPFRVSEFWRNLPRVARHPGLSTLVPPGTSPSTHTPLLSSNPTWDQTRGERRSNLFVSSLYSAILNRRLVCNLGIRQFGGWPRKQLTPSLRCKVTSGGMPRWEPTPLGRS
jgi:hypothetical protein